MSGGLWLSLNRKLSITTTPLAGFGRSFLRVPVYSSFRAACAFALSIALTTCLGCGAFYDEGSASQARLLTSHKTFAGRPRARQCLTTFQNTALTSASMSGLDVYTGVPSRLVTTKAQQLFTLNVVNRERATASLPLQASLHLSKFTSKAV
jgi:hypothetical protein